MSTSTLPTLSPALVDLVCLRVSQINNCAYCLDTHTRDLMKKGMKVEKLALVQAWWEGGNLFDQRERAALAWAESVTRVAETGVPDAGYEEVRAVFDECELVDLTITISVVNAYNRYGDQFPGRASGRSRGIEVLEVWIARHRHRNGVAPTPMLARELPT